MDWTSAFFKIVGREPSEAERAQLQDSAWHIGGNEPLLALLLVIHPSLGPRVPHPRRTLARTHPRPGARKRLSPRLLVGLISAALVYSAAVGVLSLVLATSDAIGCHLPPSLLALVTARCGWTMLVILVAPACYGVLWGWGQALDDANGWSRRVAGSAAMTALLFGVGGWIALLSAV